MTEEEERLYLTQELDQARKELTKFRKETGGSSAQLNDMASEIPLVQKLVFMRKASSIVKMARKRGPLVATAGCNTVRVIPPLIISKEEAIQGVSKFAGAIEQFAQQA